MVPAKGLEPPWSCDRRILSPVRLPVSPRRQRTFQSCRPRMLLSGTHLLIKRQFSIIDSRYKHAGMTNCKIVKSIAKSTEF
jgi:hypothetical protein